MAMMNEMEYRTIGSALAGGYRAAVYCRLSKDDDLQGESASIANQRDMLEKYCEKQGWEVVAVYQDDGFTGLNMERPDLQRMLRAIERRQINLVITKDLSRLGRNYLQTGHLIEVVNGMFMVCSVVAFGSALDKLAFMGVPLPAFLMPLVNALRRRLSYHLSNVVRDPRLADELNASLAARGVAEKRREDEPVLEEVRDG